MVYPTRLMIRLWERLESCPARWLRVSRSRAKGSSCASQFCPTQSWTPPGLQGHWHDDDLKGPLQGEGSLILLSSFFASFFPPNSGFYIEKSEGNLIIKTKVALYWVMWFGESFCEPSRLGCVWVVLSFQTQVLFPSYSLWIRAAHHLMASVL